MEIKFSKGDKVLIVKDGGNASEHNVKKLSTMGAYGLESLYLTFEVEGTVKLSNISPDNRSMAYLLNYNGSPIGYVRQWAIEKISSIEEHNDKER
jgi:hypothetical protein